MADLLLTAGSRQALAEVKLGHLISSKQQEKHEALKLKPDLYLAALSSDKIRIATGSGRWSFLSLCDLVSTSESSADGLAQVLTKEVARVVQKWGKKVLAVFAPRDPERQLPLSVLEAARIGRECAYPAHACRNRLTLKSVSFNGSANFTRRRRKNSFPVPALSSSVIDPLWSQFKILLPTIDDRHPPGRHRRRVADRIIFDKLVFGGA